MFFVDDTFGAVAIKKIDGEEESFGKQAKSRVGFYEEVQEIWSHVPLDLGLNVNGGNVGQSVNLGLERFIEKGWTRYLHLLHLAEMVIPIFETSQIGQLLGQGDLNMFFGLPLVFAGLKLEATIMVFNKIGVARLMVVGHIIA